MSLKLTQSVNQQQRLSTRQKLEIKLSLAQSLSDNGITPFQDALLGDPADLLMKVIRKVISSIDKEQSRQVLLELFSDSVLLQEMISYHLKIAIPDDLRLKDFCARFIHIVHSGSFAIETENRVSHYSCDLGDFTTAFTNPSSLKNEREKLIEAIDIKKEAAASGGAEIGDISATTNRIANIGKVLEVAELISPAIDSYMNALKIVCILKAGEAASPVSMFLREYALLKRLNPEVSERIQKRFVSRFKGCRSRSAPNLRTAFLNTLAEYVMVSMGVISPEVFQLWRSEVNLSDLKRDFAKAGLNLLDTLDYYKLVDSGPIWWNRWKTVEMKQSRKTDEQVRQFMVKHVRNEGDALLALVEYDSFFEELQTADDSDDRDIEMRELLVDKLRDPAVFDGLLHLSKTKLYPALEQFYRQ